MAVSWRQRHISDGLRGRGNALHRMVSGGVNALGSVIGGLLVARRRARLPFLPETATAEGRA
ncbi:hypothetical protein ACGFNX_07565 [Streptomyces sp. NPDC048723]|uniref:hypothetical protein n=1 Tax=unclassified Streptomyces TaxID=2593676 RepID=UPI0035615548